MSARVLVLEDDADVRRALQRFADRRGFSTRAVGTVEAALGILREEGADLMIADINLPDGSGVELIETLQGTASAVPTILITGLHDMALAAEGMKAGAAEFLTKPLDLHHLGEVMEEILAGSGRVMSAPERSEVSGEPPRRPRLVGRHPSIVELFKRIGVAAYGSSPVLIRGESGVGKELVAREIHRHSRPGKPFTALNCASVPDALLESELFGYEKGAFTGATSAQRGRFEVAADGTLFLDEIGDASPSFQGTILRSLQEGEFLPLGSERPRPIRARVVAATHRPLEERVREGTFRADLFYRIQVLEMDVSPLRDRLSDLPELARYLAGRSAERLGWPVPDIAPEAVRLLQGHNWPGNVRELENVIERAVVRSRGDAILPGHVELPHEGVDERRPGPDASLDEVVRRHAERMLERCGGNKREAARRLDISPGRLYRILDDDGA